MEEIGNPSTHDTPTPIAAVHNDSAEAPFPSRTLPQMEPQLKKRKKSGRSRDKPGATTSIDEPMTKIKKVSPRAIQRTHTTAGPESIRQTQELTGDITLTTADHPVIPTADATEGRAIPPVDTTRHAVIPPDNTIPTADTIPPADTQSLIIPPAIITENLAIPPAKISSPATLLNVSDGATKKVVGNARFGPRKPNKPRISLP